MRTNAIIIIAAVIIIIIAAGAAIMLMGGTANNQTVTANGTKIDFHNNNTQTWTHIDLQIANATNKNGTTTTYYGEIWIKPGENKTVDLSNLLGYTGPLPTGTTIKMLTWSGPFNTNSGGNSNLNMTLTGWSNTTTPGNAPTYNVTSLNMPIGALPGSITSTGITIGPNATSIETPNEGNGDSFATFFTEEVITIDSNGNVVISFTTPGGLSQTIARLI